MRALTPELVKKLAEKYGPTIDIKANPDILKDILVDIGIEVGHDAGYQKTYIKDQPEYGKTYTQYDKTIDDITDHTIFEHPIFKTKIVLNPNLQFDPNLGQKP